MGLCESFDFSDIAKIPIVLFSNISKHGAGKERQGNKKELVICGELPKVMFLGEKAGNQDNSLGIRTLSFITNLKSFNLRSDMTGCVYGMSNGQVYFLVLWVALGCIAYSLLGEWGASHFENWIFLFESKRYPRVSPLWALYCMLVY